MKFIIYGAGVRGKKIIAKWGGTPDSEILGVYDQRKTGEVLGIPIARYEDGDRDIPVVISLADVKIVVKIVQDLRDVGYQKIYWYKENPYDDTFTGQLDDMSMWGETFLPSVEMHISDACNLNCRGCTHFSPLFHHVDADLESRLSDVRKLKSKVSYIVDFTLLGGEPFLNPEVNGYIEGIRKILPDTRLNLITNGLLIPKLPQDVLDCIRRNRVIVGISEYEPTHEIIGDITKPLSDAGVKYLIRSFSKKQKFNKPIELHPSGKYQKKCISDGCVNIYNGLVCRCPTLMYAFKFNEAFGAHLPTDGIMTLDEAPEGAEFLKILREAVPLCEHCVENPMPWSRCEGKPSISDFAATES